MSPADRGAADSTLTEDGPDSTAPVPDTAPDPDTAPVLGERAGTATRADPGHDEPGAAPAAPADSDDQPADDVPAPADGPAPRTEARLAGAIPVVVGLVAGAAVLLTHLFAALRVDRVVATLGEGQLAAAAFVARGTDVVADALPPADMFAARQLAALQVLLPTDGVAVVDGVRWACLAAGLLVALLLWPIQRALGLSAPAAAAGMLVAGALPPTIAVHTGVTAGAPAALWLAVAAALVVREQGRGRGTVAVAAVLALVAVLTAPLLLAALLALVAHAVIDRSLLRGLPTRVQFALGGFLGVLAVVAGVLAIGDGPLAGVGGPLLGAAGAIGCALLGAVVLGVGWWRARWLRPLLSPAVLLLLVVLFVPGPSRATAAVLVIPVLALGVGVLVDDLVRQRWVVPVLLVAAVATVVAAVLPVDPPPPAGPDLDALVGWARTEVDPAWTLRADALDRAEFAAAGFPTDRLRAATGPAAPDELQVVSDRPQAGPLPCPVGSTLAATDRGAGGVRTVVCPADARLGSALTAERAARARIGATLADNPALTVSPAADVALRSGAVDSRLLVVLAAMSTSHRLGVEAFPATDPDVAGAPLRRVLLSTVDDVAASGDPLPVLRSWLGGQQPPFAPALIEADGPAVLVGYPAPGQTGLLPTP